ARAPGSAQGMTQNLAAPASPAPTAAPAPTHPTTRRVNPAASRRRRAAATRRTTVSGRATASPDGSNASSRGSHPACRSPEGEHGQDGIDAHGVYPYGGPPQWKRTIGAVVHPERRQPDAESAAETLPLVQEDLDHIERGSLQPITPQGMDDGRHHPYVRIGQYRDHFPALGWEGRTVPQHQELRSEGGESDEGED